MEDKKWDYVQAIAEDEYDCKASFESCSYFFKDSQKVYNSPSQKETVWDEFERRSHTEVVKPQNQNEIYKLKPYGYPNGPI